MNDFEGVLKDMAALHERKNHDYGDAFAKSFAEFGVIAAVVRMSDKMERLKSLCKKEARVEESMKDTLIDLACYAVMTVVELKHQQEKEIIDKI